MQKPVSLGGNGMQSPAYDLVIFDCDGVLVDSERLSAETLTVLMAEVGFTMTPAIFREDFLGRSFAAAILRCEGRTGRRLPDDFPRQYRTRLLARMRKDLKPMPGVVAVLEKMSVPFCLATSSSAERLATSLQVTGLARYFEGRCFTASQVANGKPAPDLFLLAAERMGHMASRCLVIEDSEMGVRAARNAGMAVWQFLGGGHMQGGYQLPAGIEVDSIIVDMADAKAKLAALGLCQALSKVD